MIKDEEWTTDTCRFSPPLSGNRFMFVDLRKDKRDMTILFSNGSTESEREP